MSSTITSDVPLMGLAIVTYGIDADAPVTEGKFLQLRWRGHEHLIFVAKHLDRFHNQILARFLADRGIAHRWADEQVLEFDREVVRVIGGGRFRLNRENRTLELWDNSQAYGRFDEIELKQKIAACESPWSGFSITIA